LNELLPKIRDKANQLELKFLWYTPTQYCRFNPVELGLGVKSCTAAMINMCVGPNGDIYPCQSYFESLGNVLKDDWQKIWNHPLAANKKQRIRGAKMQRLPTTTNLRRRISIRTAKQELHLR